MRNPVLADNRDIEIREREPKTCLLEWMEIITQGIYPSEQRLEYLLDHIERAP